MSTFTPPQVQDTPPILPDSRGPAKHLFRFFPNRFRYVTVFALSDGSFVQDTATAENSNTNIPQPYNPYEPGSPYASYEFYDYDLRQPVVEDIALPVFITKQYGYGPQEVSSDEATALTAAGYGDLIT